MTALLICLSIFYIMMGIFTHLLVDSIFLGIKIWYTVLVILFWPLVTLFGIMYLALMAILLCFFKIKQFLKRK